MWAGQLQRDSWTAVDQSDQTITILSNCIEVQVSAQNALRMHNDAINR